MSFFDSLLNTLQSILPEDQNYKTPVIIMVTSFFIFRLMRMLVTRVVASARWRALLKKSLPVAEVFFWVAFSIWAIFNFVVEGDSKKETGNVVFLVLIVIVIALFAWFVLRDLIAGLILRLEGVFELGDRVRANQLEGLVKRLGYRALVLETEEGELITLPYSKLTNEVNAKLQRNGSNISKKLQLEIPKQKTWEETHQILLKLLLNAPWSLVNQQAMVKLVGEREDFFLVDCIVHVLDHEHLPRLNDYLKHQQLIELRVGKK